MKTKNEKILLAILVAIVFLGGNYYGYLWISKKQAALELSYRQLHTDQVEAEIELEDQDKWAQRKDWVQAHEPVMGEEGATKAEVLKVVSDGARANKLEILDQGLGNVDHGAAGSRVSVTIKVKGSMEGLCHWLAELQKPESFYAVSIPSLQADQDMKSFLCQLRVVRYYKDN